MYRSQVGAHPTLVQSAVNMVLVPRRRVERWNITVEALDQPVSQLVKYIGLMDNSSESGEGVMNVVGGSGRKESHLTAPKAFVQW
jgi:hypothetical protein